MTPDVVVDVGNSRMKWGRCAGGRVAEMASLPLDDPGRWAEQFHSWGLAAPLRWAMAGVNPAAELSFREWATGTGDEVTQIADYRAVPLRVAVDEPGRLGIDRLLTALAAWTASRPRPAVVFSIGTALTGDLIDATGTFLGGAILPGPQLMARALHEHTAALPLVDATNLHTLYCPGRDTRRAIELGIGTAVGGAVRRLIELYTLHLDSPPVVFLTGGGMGPFADVEADETWTPDPEDTRFVPTLTLDGVRLAAEGLP